MNIRRLLLTLVALNAWQMIHAAPFIYVGNDNDTTVSVIDAATDDVIATIDLGVQPNLGVDITPDNSTVFVACTDNTVKRISVATNTLISPDISMGAATPNDLAVTPDGLYVYVTCNDNTVKRINIATLSVDVTISGFNNPMIITIAPNGLTAYVGNGSAPIGIIPIDIATNTLGTIVTGAPIVNPFSLTVDPSNTYLYMANDSASNVIQFNLSNRLSPSASNTISLAGFIVGVAVTPDGGYLYATNTTGNSIFPINISNPASPVVGTAVTAGIGPGPALIITPNGSYAYIPNINDDSVTPLNITNRAAPVAGPDITVGSKPAGITITSVPAPTGVSGIVKTNTFLLQTQFVLVITWTPNTANAMASPAAYNIYFGTSLVQTVSANCPAVANIYLPSCNDQNSYFISTVYSDGTESMHVPVVVS